MGEKLPGVLGDGCTAYRETAYRRKFYTAYRVALLISYRVPRLPMPPKCWGVLRKRMGFVLEVCQQCVESVLEVRGKWVGSAWEVRGKSRGKLFWSAGESIKLSTPRKITTQKCARECVVTVSELCLQVLQVPGQPW